MDDQHNITRWLAGLKAGDQEQSRKLWEAYFHKLVRLVERKLPAHSRRVFGCSKRAVQRRLEIIRRTWREQGAETGSES